MINHGVPLFFLLSFGIVYLAHASSVESWIAVWDCNSAGKPISTAAGLQLVKPIGCISQRILIGSSQPSNQGQVTVYFFDHDICNAKLESESGLSQSLLQGKSPKFYSWHRCVNTPLGKVLFQKVEAPAGRIPAFVECVASLRNLRVSVFLDKLSSLIYYCCDLIQY